METDRLDSLLDASAPSAAPRRSDELRRMIADARGVASTSRRTRRAAVLSAALAALLVGGAGVATASSDWKWIPGLEDPDRSYAYVSPTWGQCEIRYSGIDTHNFLIQAEVNRIIDEWFATADVEAEAAPFVAPSLARIEADQAAEGAEERDPRTPDLNAWMAHDQALSEAMHSVLVAHGYDSGEGDLEGAESHSQLHCEGEDWDGTGGQR